MIRTGKYGVQKAFTFVIPKASSTDFAATADWTPATGDTKISKDGGNVANTTNNPSAVAGTGSVMWTLTLTATEMQAAVIDIQFVDAATKAVTDQAMKIYTYGNASAEMKQDWSDSIRMGLTALPNAAAEAAGGLFTRGTGAGQINQAANGMVDINQVRLLGTAVSTPATAGILDVNLKNIANAAVSVTTAQLGVNTVNINNAAAASYGSTEKANLNHIQADYLAAEKAAIDLLDDGATGAMHLAIADAICDEATSGHATAGTMGKELSDVNGHVSADYGSTEKSAIDLLDDAYTGTMHAAIADAIWEEAKSGHTTSTTFGDLGAEGFTVSVGTGAGQVNVASGKVPAKIAAGDLATDSLTADALKTDAVTEIVHGILDHAIAGHLTAATVGNLIASLAGKMTVVSNQLIVYAADNATELFRFNLTDAATNPTMTDVYTRTKV